MSDKSESTVTRYVVTYERVTESFATTLHRPPEEGTITGGGWALDRVLAAGDGVMVVWRWEDPPHEERERCHCCKTSLPHTASQHVAAVRAWRP